MRSAVCAAIILALVCSVGSALAQESKPAPCDLGQNAALVYWRAFALFPEMTKDEEQFVSPDPHLPRVDMTPAQQEGLAQRWEPVFDLLRQAEKIPACDWGVNYQREGPLAWVPHLAKARAVARAAAFYANYLWGIGQRKEAAKALRTTVILARRIGNGGNDTLLEALVQIAMEARVNQAAGRLLTDRESADALSNVFGGLVNGSPEPLASNGVLAEKKLIVPWLRRAVSDNSNEVMENILGGPVFRRKLVGNPGMLEILSEEKLIPGLIGYPLKDVPQALDEVEKGHGEVAEIYRLPFPEYLARKSALEEKVEAGGKKNPFWAALLPAVMLAREEEERYRIRWAMFRAAIQIRDDGEGALDKVLNPADGKPFIYTDLGGGAFELKSDLKIIDQEVAMAFGAAPAK
jgi:hypothetical protein